MLDKKKQLLALVIAACLGTSAAQADELTGTLKKIKETGTITLSVRMVEGDAVRCRARDRIDLAVRSPVPPGAAGRSRQQHHRRPVYCRLGSRKSGWPYRLNNH